MKTFLFFVCWLFMGTVNAVTTEDYLFAKGYSAREISLILRGGQEVQNELDFRFRLKMLGNSESDVENEAHKRFPNSKLAMLLGLDSGKASRAAADGDRYIEPLREKEKRVQGIIEKAAETHAVPRALILAVIRAESNFNPHAVSKVGATGMMQLMLPTARDLGVGDSFDPQENIMGGARYLKMMLDRFGDLDLALAAYNAGPESVEKAGRRIPNYPAVRKYIKDVKRFYQRYT